MSTMQKGGNVMRLSQQSFGTGTAHACKRGRGFELKITENKSSKVASRGHGPGTRTRDRRIASLPTRPPC